MTALLEIRDITKKYGPNTVLHSVSMSVRKGEVIGLIGENGAGKSTLLKILAGVQRADGGALSLDGDEVDFHRPAQAASCGIGVVHQEQSLLPNLTVAQNLVLGDERDSVTLGVTRPRAMRSRARAMLDVVGSTVSPSEVVENLSFAQRQMVEIARAAGGRTNGRPPILVLDEPTSVLEPEDVEVLHERVCALRELGAVIFVSHRLDEVLRFSDRVYVLRDGHLVGESDAADASESALYSMMIGKSAADEIYSADRKTPVPPTERPLLSIRGLRSGADFHDVDLDVAPGEIVCAVGVVGSGREHLAKSIFGAAPIDGGTIELDGQRLTPRTPADATRRGVGYVPSERRTEGMVGGLTVAENIALAHPAHARNGRLATNRAVESMAGEWIGKLKIRPADPAVDIARLSGGNQQKVVLAKWILDDELRLLILDHPTRGLDIGAKEDLYALFRDLSERGVAILVLADTLDEAVGVGHRVVAMRDGGVTADFDSSAGNPPAHIQILEKMM